MRKEHSGDGAFSIEKHLNERVLKISHNKIHEILKEGLMVIENLNKKLIKQKNYEISGNNTNKTRGHCERKNISSIATQHKVDS